MPRPDHGAPGTQAATIDTATSLDAGTAAQAADLAAAAATADGVAPLSEQGLLHLRYGGQGVRHLLLWRGTGLAGYAQLVTGPAGDGTGPGEISGELVIAPAARRQGLGRLLTAAVQDQAAGQPVRIWAHGGLPAAAGLASATGFALVRSLYQLRMPLTAELDPPRLPAGVTLRTFVSGQDEAAWLTVNHQAFAHHPEQGGWTMDDLQQRELEDWFDPDGFFLAERDGRLAGFHWTKIHAHGDGDSGTEPIGEVYVVGVVPGEQGTGLGRALTTTGLRYLRSRGLAQVMLYVDGDNEAAVRLYESLGFTRWRADLMYAWPPGG